MVETKDKGYATGTCRHLVGQTEGDATGAVLSLYSNRATTTLHILYLHTMLCITYICVFKYTYGYIIYIYMNALPLTHAARMLTPFVP